MYSSKLLAIGCGAYFALIADATAQTSQDIPRLFGPAVALAEDAVIGRISSLSLFSDGSLLAVDHSRKDVTRFSPQGKIIWRLGATGRGPGEFTLPTLAVVLQDQTFYVFDLGRRTVSHFTSDGRYKGEVTPDLPGDLAGALLLPDGNIAVLGVTTDPRGRGLGVHVYNQQLKHLRSFGPLSESADPVLRNEYGPGGMTLGDDGLLYHTRYYPYEVRAFRSDGTLVNTVPIALKVARPEEYVRVVREGGRVVTHYDQKVTRGLRLYRLPDGRFLGGRRIGPRNTFDLISPSGKLIGSMPFPEDWSSLSAIDYKSTTFWITGTRDDVPVLWHVDFGKSLRR